MDVREHTTLGDSDVMQQLIKLLVVAYGKLDVAGCDAFLFVVATSIAREFQDFCA